MGLGDGRRASERKEKQLAVCLTGKHPWASKNSEVPGRVRNGRTAGETGLQNPKAEGSLRIQLVQSLQTRIFFARAEGGVETP